MDHGPNTNALCWKTFELSVAHSGEVMVLPEHHCLLQCYQAAGVERPCTLPNVVYTGRNLHWKHPRLPPLGLPAGPESPRVISERPQVVHDIRPTKQAGCNGTAEFLGGPSAYSDVCIVIMRAPNDINHHARA